MIVVYPNKKRLFSDFLVSVATGTLLFGTGLLVFLSDKVTIGSGLFASVLCLVGASLFVLAGAAGYWIFSKAPSLQVDSMGVQVRNIFGQIQRAPWNKISKISAAREGESPTRLDITSRYIHFRRVDEKNDRVKPLMNIPEYRLDEPFEDVVQKILSSPEAASLADDSFRSAVARPPTAFAWRFFAAIRYVVVGSICAYLVYTFLALQPKSSRSTVSLAAAVDLTPTRVQVQCSRNDNNAPVNCEIAEDFISGGSKRRVEVEKVTRTSVTTAEYTTFYLNSASGKTPIATVNLNRVHKGWDSEKQEPFNSLNKLNGFITRSRERSISVTFTQPDL